MKPSIILQDFKKNMLSLAADKSSATDSIDNAKMAVDAIAKPVNYDVYSTVKKLATITRAVSLSDSESLALSAIGVTCEGKLSKDVRDNLKKVSTPFIALCEKYDADCLAASDKVAKLETKLADIERDATGEVSKRDKGIEKFLNSVSVTIAKQFGVNPPTGRFIAETRDYVLGCNSEDLAEFEGALLELSKCDSSKSPSACKSYLVGLELPYLSEFINKLGNVVAAPAQDPNLEPDNAPTPPTEPVRKKWREFAVSYAEECFNRDELTNKSFVRLMALSRRIVKHAQTGVLSTIRAAEKSGIISGRLDSAVMLTIGNMHKILQGGINAGVRLAVETGGKDLSILNKVTQSPLVWGEKTGFNLADFKTYIEDVLPHLEFKKGVWVIRSQRALENRGLGSFGVHLFGQVPARLVTDKPPLFPMLDWLQFRELKRLYTREAAAANKAAKADYQNAWREFEESFPLETQIETLEAQLSKLDAERQALADKAAKLKAAL